MSTNASQGPSLSIVELNSKRLRWLIVIMRMYANIDCSFRATIWLRSRLVTECGSRMLISHSVQATEGLKHLPLPPEIRNQIYKLVLQIPNCFKTRAAPNSSIIVKHPRTGGFLLRPPRLYGYPLDRKLKNPIDLSLLLVSKTTFLEAWHIFYRINTLYFADTGTLLHFLRNIGYARRQQLTDVGFDWIGLEAKAAFRLLATCSGLKTVRFSVHCSRPVGYDALREVRGIARVVPLDDQLCDDSGQSLLPNWMTWELMHGPTTSNSDDYSDCILHPWTSKGPVLRYVCNVRCRDFEELKNSMMRPRPAWQTKSLEHKSQIEQLLGGKREIFRGSEEDSLLAETREWMATPAVRSWCYTHPGLYPI